MEDRNYYGNNCSISSNNCNTNSNINGNTANNVATVIHGATLDFANPEILSSTHMNEDPNNEGYMDIIFDDLLRETHAQNDETNNYIDLFHAELLSSPNNEDKSISENDESTQALEQSNCNKRTRHEKGDNKEAVRRYREKLKAREAALQEEANKLKASNQELLKRLQSEEALQDEIYLLKCLLVDIRGRIEGEIHSFRHFRPSTNNADCSNGYNHHMIQQYSNNGADESNKVYDTTPTLPSQPKMFFNFKRDV